MNMNTNAVANAMITKLNPISSGSEEDTDGIPKMLLVTGEGIAIFKDISASPLQPFFLVSPQSNE